MILSHMLTTAFKHLLRRDREHRVTMVAGDSHYIFQYEELLHYIFSCLGAYERSRICSVSKIWYKLSIRASKEASVLPELYDSTPTVISYNTYLQVTKDYHLLVRCKHALRDFNVHMPIPRDPNIAACVMVNSQRKEFRVSCEYVHGKTWDSITDPRDPTRRVLSMIKRKKYAVPLNDMGQLCVDAELNNLAEVISFTNSYEILCYFEHLGDTLLNITFLYACIGGAGDVIDYLMKRYPHNITHGFSGALIIGDFELADKLFKAKPENAEEIIYGAIVNGDVGIIKRALEYKPVLDYEYIAGFLRLCIMFENMDALDFIYSLEHVTFINLIIMVCGYGKIKSAEYITSNKEFTHEICIIAIEQARLYKNKSVKKHFKAFR